MMALWQPDSGPHWPLTTPLAGLLLLLLVAVAAPSFALPVSGGSAGTAPPSASGAASFAAVSSSSAASPAIDDCAIRHFALEYSAHVLSAVEGAPFSSTALRDVAAALSTAGCNTSVPTAGSARGGDRAAGGGSSAGREQSLPSFCPVELFVDAVSGSDSNAGSIGAPFRSIQRALLVSRAVPRSSTAVGSTAVCISLRAGTFYLGSRATATESGSHTSSGGGESSQSGARQELRQTRWAADADSRQGAIALTGADSGLTLRAYQGESVTLSGGVDLSASLKWQPYSRQSGVLQSALPDSVALPIVDARHFNELYVDDRRAIRCKFPNGDPSTNGYLWNGAGYSAGAASWLPQRPFNASTEVHVASPQRANTHFPQYQMGLGGAAKPFYPSRSFWALAAPPGGGGSTYSIPSGLTLGSDWGRRASNWSDVGSGLVFAMHNGYWGSWVFEVDSWQANRSAVLFARGGHQEARGSPVGGAYYVAHILEELDSPLEWFVNYTARTLYFMPNPLPAAAFRGRAAALHPQRHWRQPRQPGTRHPHRGADAGSHGQYVHAAVRGAIRR